MLASHLLLPGELPLIIYLLMVLAAALLYALMSAFMKMAVAVGDASAVFVARYLFASATLIPIYFASNRPTVRTAHLRWHLLRGTIGFCMFLLYTLALERIPLQNAMVLNSSYILFVPLLLLIFMRQQPARGAVMGLVIGFAGIIIVSRARAHVFLDWGSLFALGSAIASASATVLVAHLRRTDSSFAVLFYFFNVSLLFSVIWALGIGHPLSIGSWWILCAIGALTAIYQLMLTYALKHLSSVLASSVMTSSVVFGFIFDAVLFHHSASMRDYIGSLLILVGVLVTLWASHRAVVAEDELTAGYSPNREVIEHQVLPQ
jgi:S-adenosylmethionine uptake transporter